jgi:hypothetical protein
VTADYSALTVVSPASFPAAHPVRKQRWPQRQPEQHDDGEYREQHLPPVVSGIDGHRHGGDAGGAGTIGQRRATDHLPGVGVDQRGAGRRVDRSGGGIGAA